MLHPLPHWRLPRRTWCHLHQTTNQGFSPVMSQRIRALRPHASGLHPSCRHNRLRPSRLVRRHARLCRSVLRHHCQWRSLAPHHVLAGRVAPLSVLSDIARYCFFSCRKYIGLLIPGARFSSAARSIRCGAFSQQFPSGHNCAAHSGPPVLGIWTCCRSCFAYTSCNIVIQFSPSHPQSLIAVYAFDNVLQPQSYCQLSILLSSIRYPMLSRLACSANIYRLRINCIKFSIDKLFSPLYASASIQLHSNLHIFPLLTVPSNLDKLLQSVH